MKTIYQLYLIGAVCLLVTASASAQTPTDALLMSRGQACVLVEGNNSSFDFYWENTTERDNQVIATVSRNTVMLMTAVGITDKLNVFVGLQYIQTGSSEPNGGKLAGVRGFQDLTVAAKYAFLQKQLGKNKLTALASVGFSTPASNYTPDYMPYSIGFGAPELAYRSIVQHDWNKGAYTRLGGSYLWRGYAQAEREFHDNNGSVYSHWMEVPNAITVEAALGKFLFKNRLQVEATYFSLNSLSGDTIRPFDAPKPTNKVNFGRVGLFGHYFSKKVNGLGIIAYYNRNITGKNAPQATTTGLGITYFSIF